MQQPAPPFRILRRLLSSCAMGLTLAALVHGGPASAQVSAIQGTSNVDAGFASIDNTGGTSAAPRTNVQVFGPNAVINWTPTDTAAGAAPIDFLPANGLAYFYSSSNPDFIVLNRVIPATTRQIGLNGEVRSNVDISGTTSPGGNVWFYSPTGFVAGTGSRFSTNGLILTANDIPYTAGSSGGGINFGPNGEIQMTAAAGSQANVTLLPGSQISNTGDDAYTLIVAPSIVQGGTIELDGSVGLIAAESVSVLIQNSLFNIDVQIGTSVANAIVHTGSTGAGAAADTLAGPQHVVVMATPANTALTVLLGGNLGATTANAAAADRSVTLSGGYDYDDINTGGLAFAPDTTTPVDFQIGTTNFNANLTALTTGSIIGNPSRGTAINFLGSASLTAGTTASLTAELDETITASQDLLLQAPISATLKLGTTNSEAGAGNGPATVNVLGNLTLNTDIFGSDSAVLAVGGISTISLDGGTVGPQLTVAGNTLLTATGFGAETAEDGGSGMGGTAQIIVNGGTVSLQNTDIIADGLGAAGIPGGSGTGGLARFIADGPQSYSLRDLTISANGTAGDTPDLTTPFGIGTGGTAQFINQGTVSAAVNSRTVRNLVLRANGDAGTVNRQPGQDSAAGRVQLSDLASGANSHASFASVSAQAFGLTVPAGSGALLESKGGLATTIATTLDVGSTGTVTLSADGNSGFAAGDSASLFSDQGDILIAHANQGSSPFPTLSVGNVNGSGQLDIHAGRDILGSGASLLEGQTASVIAGRDISGSGLAIRSRSDLALGVARNLTAGTIDVAGRLDMVDAAGTVIQANQLNVAGNLAVGNLVLRAPTPALVRATGDLTIGKAFTTGLDVATSGGALTVGGLEAYPSGLSGFLTANAPTSITLDGIRVSGAITATTGGAITIGSTQAGGTLSATTPGTITVNGQATANTVRLSSSDLVIGTNGRIGAAGTTSLVELTNNNASRRSYYGGTGNAAGYSLSGAEMGQLFGAAITLIAPQTAQSSAAVPDVTIGDMTVAGAQLGAQGTLTIQTPGRVLISGAVNFTGLSNGNTFAVRAGELIALDNQTGSVDLRGAGNTLAGRIDFSANTIIAASSATQTALAGLSDPAAIDTLLGTNDGKVSSTGVLRADSMRFAVTNGLYIQNTGASTFFPLRRGFAVGAGGIAVSTPVGRTTPLIVINGQATTSTGGSAFGLNAIPLVSINGQPAPSSSGSRAGSTINGCDFTKIDECRPPLTPELTLTRDRVQSPVEEITDTPSDLAVERQSLVTPGVELQDIGRLSYEPLIDEPVTGSGNDDLWVPACDPGKGNCPAP